MMETTKKCLLMLICSIIHFSDSQVTRFAIDCRSPEGLQGTCKIIQQCDIVLAAVKREGINNPQVQNYLQKSFCGWEGVYSKICCPAQISRNPKTSTTKPKAKTIDPRLLLPQQCGIDYSNRIVGGEIMGLDEFPWLALLEYQSPKGMSNGCGGALITKRYVLTAAHCVKSIPSNWQLKRVRLGEYNPKTDPDCIPEGDGDESETCADRVLLVGIERQIVHENYGKPRSYSNDIALLRLSLNVPDSNFIKPICLPSSPDLGQMYYGAGWGQTEFQSHSSVKLKVKLPFKSHEECAKLYATKRVYLDDNQFCAGGAAGKDTCKGDSGGPLMRQVRSTNRWIVEGVVSLGHSPCGVPGWPAVYTKVYNFVPWILKNLQP